MIRVTYPFPMEEDTQTNKHVVHLGTTYNVGRLIEYNVGRLIEYNVGRLIEPKEIWIDIKVISKGCAGILIVLTANGHVHAQIAETETAKLALSAWCGVLQDWKEI